MRRLAWVLALLLLPVGSAQAPDLGLVTMSIDPFTEHVKPLQGPVTTTVEVRISCALVRSPSGASIAYAVTSAPPWATTTLSPVTDVVPLVECDDGWVTREAQLVVQANDRAPAFRPAELVIEAKVNDADAATANVSLTAAYFSIVDVQVAEAIVVMRPGETHDFEIGVANRGNGATSLRASLGPGTDTAGLAVSLPSPFVLGSAQQGDVDTEIRVAIRVVADEAEGVVNEVRVINVAIESASAEDATAMGDGSQVSLLVTRRSGVADVPAGGLVALLAALVLGAALRRRSA